MTFLQGLLIAFVPSFAAVLSAWIGFRDLRLRRRLETSRQFVNLFAAAHGRPVDGRESIGVGEQIATIHLIADFAAEEGVLRQAAAAGLRELASWDQVKVAKQIDTSELKLDLIGVDPGEKAQEFTENLNRALDRALELDRAGKEKIAEAARIALARLQEKL